MTCQCEACAPGAPGQTYTSAWRHACEVRAIVALPTRQARSDYLDRIEQRRGSEASALLRAAVLAAWTTPTPTGMRGA